MSGKGQSGRIQTTAELNRYIDSHPADKELSTRQKRVLKGASLGESNEQIAATLGVNVSTVVSDAAAINRFLGARNRPHAIALAFRAGLLT